MLADVTTWQDDSLWHVIDRLKMEQNRRRPEPNYDLLLRKELGRLFDADYKELDAAPVSTTEIGDDSVTVEFDAYHFLHTYLDMDEKSIAMNKKYQAMYKRKDAFCLDDFLRDALKDEGLNEKDMTQIDTVTSRTGDYNIVTEPQPWELTVFDGMDGRYGLLEVGKNGYTKSGIFKLTDRDYMLGAMSEASAYCTAHRDVVIDNGLPQTQMWLFDGRQVPVICCGAVWDSDNGGSTWTFGGNNTGGVKYKGKPVIGQGKAEITFKRNEETGEWQTVCGACGAEVKFHVRDSF
jgi:hypothetical protein